MLHRSESIARRLTAWFSFAELQATACYRAAVEPSLTVFVQGKKRISLGGTAYLCAPSSFFLSSIDVPIESQVVEASEEVPLLSMLLRLDMSIVREILNREELPEGETSGQPPGVAIGQAPAGLLNAMLPAHGASRHSRGHTFSQPPNPARDHLPHPENAAGYAAPDYCNQGRPQQQNSKSDHLAQRQLCEAFAHGGPGRGRTDGSLNTSSSVSRIDRDESASIPKAVEAAEGKGADAYGWSGRHERSLRGWLRERQPIQPRIQPLLWPASHARCQSSSSYCCCCCVSQYRSDSER
jgi:AraC-type transcriptional regulator N-terminus